MATLRHKVFVSYHHYNDQGYRNQFENLFVNHYNMMVSKSVQDGDISPYMNTETVRQKIRDNYLRDSTVTIVLIGTQTWQRKHIDWEIGSSLRNTRYNSRSGLLGIILPSHPDFGKGRYTPNIIPPRLYYNNQCGYANIYDWSTNPSNVQNWIHDAFLNRNKVLPDNSYPNFVNNRSGYQWQ